MSARRHLLTALLQLTAMASVSCSSQQGSFDALSDVEREYVIPDSADWDSGPCAEDDCVGPLIVETMQSLCWAEVDQETSSVKDGFFEIARTLRGPPDDVVLSGEIDDATVSWMKEANLAGLGLIFGTECPANAMSITPILEVIAIDAKGRIAGIGIDPARLTTGSLAEAAAESGAASGEEYLLSVLSS